MIKKGFFIIGVMASGHTIKAVCDFVKLAAEMDALHAHFMNQAREQHNDAASENCDSQDAASDISIIKSPSELSSFPSIQSDNATADDQENNDAWSEIECTSVQSDNSWVVSK